LRLEAHRDRARSWPVLAVQHLQGGWHVSQRKRTRISELEREVRSLRAKVAHLELELSNARTVAAILQVRQRAPLPPSIAGATLSDDELWARLMGAGQ